MKVLYANCNDGAGAALAAWMKLGDKLDHYIPVQYDEAPPFIDDDIVLILDFSYKRQQLIELSRNAVQITLIDHHKTAQADLAEIESEMHCPTKIIFDMEKSGAVLTWEHFHSLPVPRLLEIIQDRDLWKFEFKETRDVCTALQLHDKWREWQQFIDKPHLLRTLRTSGAAINRYLYIQADAITGSERPLIPWDITGDLVPVYNLPGFMLSETLHMALEKHPAAPYAVGYFDLRDKRVYSLRSRKGSDIDVSEIAKTHGGGGHKHAAGFTR